MRVTLIIIESLNSSRVLRTPRIHMYPRWFIMHWTENGMKGVIRLLTPSTPYGTHCPSASLCGFPNWNARFPSNYTCNASTCLVQNAENGNRWNLGEESLSTQRFVLANKTIILAVECDFAFCFSKGWYKRCCRQSRRRIVVPLRITTMEIPSSKKWCNPSWTKHGSLDRDMKDDR